MKNLTWEAKMFSITLEALVVQPQAKSVADS